MPRDSKIRRSVASRSKLDLPPPFRAVMLREVGDAFAHAVAIAAEDGAGTLVNVGRFDLAEFAVVLEPDEPLRTARRAIYTGMCALGDALAAIVPPEKAISFDWPGAVRLDGGLVGGARLGWPSGASEDEPPAWLVFGVMIRLDDDDIDNPDGGVLAEHFARHLMAAFDACQEKGFAEVERTYLPRLSPAEHPDVWRHAIDEEGNLLIRWPGTGKIELRSLAGALAAPCWLDPASGAPRS